MLKRLINYEYCREMLFCSQNYPTFLDGWTSNYFAREEKCNYFFHQPYFWCFCWSQNCKTPILEAEFWECCINARSAGKGNLLIFNMLPILSSKHVNVCRLNCAKKWISCKHAAAAAAASMFCHILVNLAVCWTLTDAREVHICFK